jgi:uncharacterized protein YybS (DUF2232 family)
MEWFNLFKRTTDSATRQVANKVDEVVFVAGQQLDNYAKPLRESVFRRYPTLFTLLVTVGATATFLGSEQILLSFSLFADRPWLLFLFGIVILTLTGKLYKKLE